MIKINDIFQTKSFTLMYFFDTLVGGNKKEDNVHSKSNWQYKKIYINSH